MNVVARRKPDVAAHSGTAGTAVDARSAAASGYARPAVAPPVILDDAGVPIPFGTRWGGNLPPESLYSVDRHPERFAPLLSVADALIAHLRRIYDVSVDTSGAFPDREPKDLGSIRDDIAVRRVVRLAPSRMDAAPLTFVYTEYPSVELEAGAFLVSRFPDCGCEACDEDWSSVADKLEEAVFAVVNGAFTETLSGRWLTTRLGRSDGESRYGCRVKDLRYSPSYIAKARRTLKPLTAGWQPWPRRLRTVPTADGSSP